VGKWWLTLVYLGKGEDEREAEMQRERETKLRVGSVCGKD